MPWLPSEFPSLAAWYDAADAGTIALNGSTVSQWNDKSGNARHVSQATAANQPAYAPGAITFDGTNDHLTASGINFSATDKLTVFMALRNVAADTTRSAFMFGAPFGSVSGLGADFPVDSQRRIRVDARGSVLAFPGSAISVATQNVTSVFGFGADIAGDSIFAFVDGAQVLNNTSDLGTGNFGTSSLFIGSYNAGAAFFSGTIYETVVVPALLSVADRQKIEGYLAWKWGTTSRLPGNHPYRYDGSLFGYANLWNPALLPSLRAWYDVSDSSTVTLNGSSVSQINDKSGNSHHAFQTVAVDQPTYLASGINGMPAMVAEGANKNLQITAGPQLASPGVLMGVVSNVQALNGGGGSGAYYLWLGVGAGSRAILARGAFQVASSFSPTLPASGQMPVTGPSVHIGFKPDVSSQSLWVDGSSLATGASTAPPTFTDWRLLNYIGGSRHSIDPVGEIVIANAYTLADQQKLEGYLAWKWGVQANLPAAHPYKNAEPTVGAAGVNASGSPAALSLAPASGAATGSSTAAAAPAAVNLTPATGNATGGASATGSASALSLTAATGAATGGSGASASGSPAALSLTQATGAATGAATTSAGAAPILLIAATGSAAGGSGASASGSPAALSIIRATGVATGAAAASSGAAPILLIAATGSASVSSGAGYATGAPAPITLAAATGTAYGTPAAGLSRTRLAIPREPRALRINAQARAMQIKH
jgi:hypothetical protein